MIDETASAYGWTIPIIIGCTLYQLKKLGSAAARRVGRDRQVMANIQRAAANADRPFFERFYDSLMPQGERGPEVDMSMPEGMTYIKGE